MKQLNFVLSLTNSENDYQLEQLTAAEEAAKRLGVQLQIISADNNAIDQSQQLLKIIQSHSDSHPDGIIFEPVGGTALPQVARAAAVAGIGWVVLNREVDYIAGLRTAYRIPAFALTTNHEEVGRIQGRQFGALLPQGGSVLYIQGPSESLAAKQRTSGMYETKPGEVQVKLMKAQWTEASAYRTVSSWLRLSTSHQTYVDLVAAQDDSMAMGARKAFSGLDNPTDRDRWLRLPYIGCDGVTKTGQSWVRTGMLKATVIIPTTAGRAISILHQALLTDRRPPERTFTTPESFPPVTQLN